MCRLRSYGSDVLAPAPCGVCRRARVALKTATGGRRIAASHKKTKKKHDDDEIRTHAILEGFTPVAEKMDCYVSHFLTGIIAGKNWPPRADASVRKTLKFV